MAALVLSLRLQMDDTVAQAGSAIPYFRPNCAGINIRSVLKGANVIDWADVLRRHSFQVIANAAEALRAKTVWHPIQDPDFQPGLDEEFPRRAVDCGEIGVAVFSVGGVPAGTRPFPIDGPGREPRLIWLRMSGRGVGDVGRGK
jgi:hypothetical protein